MNSEVIKYVAGGGKTTYSRQLLRENPRGLYLTYNNAVKDEISSEGFLALTIDAFLTGFIIPKAVSKIPLIPEGVKIVLSKEGGYRAGCRNITIRNDGSVWNGSKIIKSVNLYTEYDSFLAKGNFPNKKFLNMIFTPDSLSISHQQRDQLASFAIINFKQYILDIIRQRFSYIIIDEAQDIKLPKEPLVEALWASDIPTIILGDENQNINNGSEWFSGLEATKSELKSYRCGEGLCRWIRGNLKIDINGVEKETSYTTISFNQLDDLNDGERVLLYKAKKGSAIKDALSRWRGPSRTIQNAKGATIDQDVVIIGKTMNKRFLYTAITRTRGNVYSTIVKYQ